MKCDGIFEIYIVPSKVNYYEKNTMKKYKWDTFKKLKKRNHEIISNISHFCPQIFSNKKIANYLSYTTHPIYIQ